MIDTTNPLETRSIPITVDKSHLITIGEKLYTEKMSFIRELVNNAYDADATEIRVDISENEITIIDNGSGMDDAGLRQYFTIGSPFKKGERLSPRFGRSRIGEFGIGKFAALAAARTFEVHTQRGKFNAQLIFDKEAWSHHEDWHLNVDILPYDPSRGDGTLIRLRHLKMPFIPGKVRRYLAERTPIHLPHFAVVVNGEPVTDEIVPGKRILIDTKTQFGSIRGAIVIVPADRRITQTGIAVTVKGVLVRYETFGLDTSRKFGVTRITGKVEADFLPITSSRDEFIRDSEEFAAFCEVLKREIGKALHIVRQEGDRKANLQASRVLGDALSKIGRAMKRHGNLFPDAQVPLGDADEEGSAPVASVNGYDISQAQFVLSHEELDPAVQDRFESQKKEKKMRGRPHAILGNKSVIRTLRIQNLQIAVRLEHLGGDDESLTSGGVIYVNLDHPLYRTYVHNDELLTIHVARVITKELALHAGITDAQQAFSLQAELLTHAFKSARKDN